MEINLYHVTANSPVTSQPGSVQGGHVTWSASAAAAARQALRARPRDVATLSASRRPESCIVAAQQLLIVRTLDRRSCLTLSCERQALCPAGQLLIWQPSSPNSKILGLQMQKQPALPRSGSQQRTEDQVQLFSTRGLHIVTPSARLCPLTHLLTMGVRSCRIRAGPGDVSEPALGRTTAQLHFEKFFSHVEPALPRGAR